MKVREEKEGRLEIRMGREWLESREVMKLREEAKGRRGGMKGKEW